MITVGVGKEMNASLKMEMISFISTNKEGYSKYVIRRNKKCSIDIDKIVGKSLKWVDSTKPNSSLVDAKLGISDMKKIVSVLVKQNFEIEDFGLNSCPSAFLVLLKVSV